MGKKFAIAISFLGSLVIEGIMGKIRFSFVESIFD
jgi:hypothetical protein